MTRYKKQKGHLVTVDDKENNVAIKVDQVSKSFILPHNRQNSIKGGIISLFNGDRNFEVQEVLKDISFDIRKGEFFGIVGRNGSGKSTLLKMLAGIYTPTKGKIIINGSLTPFIELGVGFNPELTGRENVFLNGALLGFNRNEMVAMYDDIVKFAELERFMDQKLKNYSSGMQVRLAFSIAIRAQSNILVLDEVLAVGDAAFQRKCNNYFEKLKSNKKTVVLVTHDMSAVERYCDRAIMIEDGEAVIIGDPYEIAGRYSRSNDESYSRQQKTAKYESNIKISLRDRSGNKSRVFQVGEQLVVRVALDNPNINHIGLAIIRESGEYMYARNTYRDKFKINSTDKYIEYVVDLNVGVGDYFVKAATFGKNDKDVIDLLERGPTFTVNHDYSDASWDGLIHLDNEWRVAEEL